MYEDTYDYDVICRLIRKFYGRIRRDSLLETVFLEYKSISGSARDDDDELKSRMRECLVEYEASGSSFEYLKIKSKQTRKGSHILLVDMTKFGQQ